jgi:hypothetical protein
MKRGYPLHHQILPLVNEDISLQDREHKQRRKGRDCYWEVMSKNRIIKD